MKPPPLPIGVSPLVALAQTRRTFALAISITLCAAGILALLGIAALFDIPLQWSPPVRTAIAWAIAAVAGGFLVLGIRRARRHTPHEAAAALEAAHPELGQKLRTTLELDPRALAARPPADTVIARQLYADAARTLGRLNTSSLIPVGRLAAAAVGALVILLAVGITASGWDNFGRAIYASPTRGKPPPTRASSGARSRTSSMKPTRRASSSPSAAAPPSPPSSSGNRLANGRPSPSPATWTAARGMSSSPAIPRTSSSKSAPATRLSKSRPSPTGRCRN